MKLLLDQNISFRVISLILSAFPKASHVKSLGLVDASDSDIWNYALKNEFTIITFDSDFVDLATLKGTPPKIIWLRFGNSTNLKIANKLISNAEIIREFVSDKKSGIAFLEID